MGGWSESASVVQRSGQGSYERRRNLFQGKVHTIRSAHVAMSQHFPMTFLVEAEWFQPTETISKNGTRFLGADLILTPTVFDHFTSSRRSHGRTFMVWVEAHGQMYLFVDAAAMSDVVEQSAFGSDTVRVSFLCVSIQLVPYDLSRDKIRMWP